MLMLLFYVGHKGYAIDTEAVVEVIPKILIKPLLHVPPYILGTITYAGAQIPVVDFSSLTEGVSSKDAMHSRIFILSRQRGMSPPEQIGILAEKITEATEIPESKITRSGVKIKEFPYFDGVVRSGSDVIQVVDYQLLMDSMVGVVI
jgi:chemotaxis-related protein WspB